MRTTLRYRAAWVACGWLIAAAIVWLSLIPSPPRLDVEQGDKLEHFVAYGVLMFWFCELYASRRSRLAYAVAWTAMGIAIEFIQGAVGYRSYDPLDMLADAIGVLLGFVAALALGPRLFANIERILPH
jgi:VanZ family protein